MADAGEADTRIRVLVVDDHPLFRAGIRERIEVVDGPIVVVGEAEDGLRAYDLVGRLRPDVVLIDISMPGMNGIEATRMIHADFPDVGIIILSVHDDDQYVHAALDAGANGYLLKTIEAAELRGFIVGVARGEPALSPSIARKVLTLLSGTPTDTKRLSDPRAASWTARSGWRGKQDDCQRTIHEHQNRCIKTHAQHLREVGVTHRSSYQPGCSPSMDSAHRCRLRRPLPNRPPNP